MPNYPSLDVVRRSATPELEPRARLGQDTVVAKLIDVSKCTGCKACQSACSEWNDVVAPVGINTGSLQHPPDLSAEAWTVVRFDEVDNQETGDLEWLIRKESCMHCADPGCLKACPSPGAIVQYGNGIVDFDEANCIGCGYCVKGCPFNIPRYGKEDRKAYKCTMCADRVAVGLEPACVKSCPTEALMFGTKQDMVALAEDRVTELQSLGFQQAGLYDPQGVGGTHVMYVLPHADKPELYGGLPKDPHISPIVKGWRSGVTLFGIGVMAVSAIAAFVHYLTVGPDEVPEKAEDEAAREATLARRNDGGAA